MAVGCSWWWRIVARVRMCLCVCLCVCVCEILMLALVKGVVRRLATGWVFFLFGGWSNGEGEVWCGGGWRWLWLR